MDTKTSPEKSLEEKFNEDFLKIAFPDWMHSSKESHDFRGLVIDKHTILENLLDLLITSYFFEKVSSEKSELFRNKVLAYMDFSKKVKVLEELGLIDKELKGLVYKVNEYRVAQSHIKKDDPLRVPSAKNLSIFKEISIKAHSKVSSKIILTDSELRTKVKKIVEQKKQSAIK